MIIPAFTQFMFNKDEYGRRLARAYEKGLKEKFPIVETRIEENLENIILMVSFSVDYRGDRNEQH